ncbi:MAG: hypothetical protein ACKVJG_04745 [Candidatus Latescibacterota bacterium]|jgi:hypothetical protein
MYWNIFSAIVEGNDPIVSWEQLTGIIGNQPTTENSYVHKDN